MTNTHSKPIFLVSSPRSGSTLLRLILDAHPNIAIPPPGYIFHFLYPYLYSYGDLNNEDNFRELVEDFLEIPTIKQWPIEYTIDDVMANVTERNYRGIYEYVHVKYMTAQDKPRWGNKSPRNGFWLDEIKALFPDVKIVHLVRDGRDVALDLAEADFQPHSVYCGALRWDECIQVAEDSSQRLGPESFLEVHYEALCADPEKTLKQICNFIGEDFSPDMLCHHETEAAKTWGKNPVHAKIMRPISTDFVGMYKTRLSETDNAAIEAVIGETLKRKGYKLETKPKPISVQEAAQMIEGDMVSQLGKAQYKYWHRERRVKRRERGVWKDSDRKSLLWSLD
jgi:hypothetical protein